MSEVIRRVVFRPYRKGQGPTFTLTIRDAGERWHDNGQRRTHLAYRLSMTESKYTARMKYRRISTLLFEGQDFSPSPLHAIDSDAAVVGLMGFLTLRPGDTDRDYFDKYTPEQWAFVEQHAEALSADVEARFGED